jgi:hypothetical protein
VDGTRHEAGTHPIEASQREGGRSAVVLAAEAEWMEREELRKGTKRKASENEQAGAEVTWKEMMGMEPRANGGRLDAAIRWGTR